MAIINHAELVCHLDELIGIYDQMVNDEPSMGINHPGDLALLTIDIEIISRLINIREITVKISTAMKLENL